MPRHFGHCGKDGIVQRGLADLGGKVVCDHSIDATISRSLYLEIFDPLKHLVAANPVAAGLSRVVDRSEEIASGRRTQGLPSKPLLISAAAPRFQE
jgi:hypothetical protein